MCSTWATAAECSVACFLQKLVLIWKKKIKKPVQSQHDITAGPIVCRFTQPPISLPALPFTHRALYHSHTWKSVTSSPNTTSLLFPLALWRQQGSPLLALIYNAVKLNQTCVFMRALISIVCACVYSQEENCQSKMKPWLHSNSETPASSERRRAQWNPKCVSLPEMLRNDKRNQLYWKSKRASPHLMSHSFWVAMAAWRWAIITVHPPPPESRTRRRDMSSICSSRVHDPRV